MIKTISLAAGLAMALSTISFAQAPNSPAPSQTTAPDNPPGMTSPAQQTPQSSMPNQAQPRQNAPNQVVNSQTAPATLSAEDRRFVQKVEASDIAEVQESQLAQTKAKNDEVKSFAERVIADHSAADDKLKSIVQSAGVQEPANLDRSGQKQVDALRKLRGAAFDKQFVKDQVSAHKATLALFEKEATSGTAPQLKQFANDTLPTLKQHLNDAQGLASRSVH